MSFPKIEAEIEALLQIWALKAPNHKSIYILTDAQLVQISDDSIIYTHTRLVRQIFDDEKAEFSAWKENMFLGNPLGTAQPFPTIAIPALPTLQGTLKPGIVARNTELYNYFKNHPNRTAESLADLGITDAPAASISFENLVPSLKVWAIENYEVVVSFYKQGMSGLRIEWRRKGGAWQFATNALASPCTFSIPASTPGEAEQIEIRGSFLQKNEPVGQFSPAYSVIIKP